MNKLETLFKRENNPQEIENFKNLDPQDILTSFENLEDTVDILFLKLDTMAKYINRMENKLRPRVPFYLKVNEKDTLAWHLKEGNKHYRFFLITENMSNRPLTETKFDERIRILPHFNTFLRAFESYLKEMSYLIESEVLQKL